MICRRHNIPLNLIVNIDIWDDLLFQWISDRWIHLPSGRTYSASYNPPKIPGLDDVTGEPLVKRSDDNPVCPLFPRVGWALINHRLRKHLRVASSIIMSKPRLSFITTPHAHMRRVSWICTETRTSSCLRWRQSCANLFRVSGNASCPVHGRDSDSHTSGWRYIPRLPSQMDSALHRRRWSNTSSRI